MTEFPPPEYFDPPDQPKEPQHWSEKSGQWYYVGSVGGQWDHIIHDVEAEDLMAEMEGMHLLWKDGTVQAAPTTRAAWQALDAMTDSFAEDPEPVCVGRVVDGKCVPIGADDDDGEPCPYCDGTGNMGSEGLEADCPECGGTGCEYEAGEEA